MVHSASSRTQQQNGNKICKISNTHHYPPPLIASNLPFHLLQNPRYPHQHRQPPHPRQQLPRLHTTHRDPRHHRYWHTLYSPPLRGSQRGSYSASPPHTNHHPKRTLHPAILPLLHHFICYICFICYINI